MITKDLEVGPRGDCIIAVAADKGAAGVGRRLKKAIRSGAPITITIEAGGITEKIRAVGHPSLMLNHPRDLVVRKSGFVCERTLAIRADKAAGDLSRDFVKHLCNSTVRVRILIETRA